jgi:2-polyprenyl-6-hydroxyphenyl methylase/3-demethylubiquinone-9 3-methyltransferase
MGPTSTGHRFAFGKNWESFAAIADEESISEAQRGLTKLFPNGELRGARMLDVGCGAGLSMAAALRLGASQVDGVDIDSNSTKAARNLLSRFDVGKNWSADTGSLFDVPVRPYDIVYSWGVLHHTGAMWRALERVTAFVRPGGLLAVAIYRRSPVCTFWQWEKRFYSSAPPPVRLFIRSLYKTAYLSAVAISGRNPFDYVFNYHHRTRGMSFHHDIHDWLGGYPYESASPDEIAGFMNKHHFSVDRSFQRPAAVKGLFGTHCDEYVAVRKQS